MAAGISPTQELLIMKLERALFSAAKTSVSLFGLNGQLIAKTEFMGTAGINTIPLKNLSVSRGLKLVEISNEKTKFTEKLSF